MEINNSDYISMFLTTTKSKYQPNESSKATTLTGYEKNKSLFWCFAVACICVAIVTIIGNGFVIIAAKRNRNTSRLRYFDGLVKSLALTDFLFGAVGVPLIVVNYYLGMYFNNRPQMKGALR